VVATASEPRLSVVIPCRNEARDLPGQLRALATQTWEGWWEVVVADNGSTDGTAQVAATFREALPRLRVVDAGDAPYRPHACNAGALAAEGDALVFLDADDEVAPEYLVAMARALQQHEFVGARLDNEFLNPEWVRGSRPNAQTDGLQDWHYLPIVAGCSMGMRRSTFLALGGFDAGMQHGDDAELCFRAQLAGVSLHFVPDAVVRYRYRQRAREIFRQARGYGRGAPALYRNYNSPVVTPARKVERALRSLVWIVRRVPRLARRSVRAAVAWDAGYLVGWVEGSLWSSRYCQPGRLLSAGSARAPAAVKL